MDEFTKYIQKLESTFHLAKMGMFCAECLYSENKLRTIENKNKKHNNNNNGGSSQRSEMNLGL